MSRAAEARETREYNLFLARVGRLTNGEMLAIIAAAESTDPWAIRFAMRTVDRAVKDDHTRVQLRAARDQIFAWAADPGPIRSIPGFPPLDPIEDDLRRRVVPALVNAATAIILGDRLLPYATRRLLAPWQSAVPARTARSR